MFNLLRNILLGKKGMPQEIKLVEVETVVRLLKCKFPVP